MTIIDSVNVNNIETKYNLTMNPEIEKMSEQEGKMIEFDAWMLYKDDEAANPVLAIQAKDGSVYATNSTTFIQSFKDIVSLFETEPDAEFTSLKVHGGTSKAGRHFITCMYAKG